METRNTKHTERRKSRKIAAVVAALLVVVMGVTSVAYAANGGSLIDAVASLFGIETQAVPGADTVVDPNTTNQWKNHTAPGGVTSTQNVGRIWTDKSVFDTDYTFEGQLEGSVGKGDSDFLVGLSALSSTSNVRETVTTTEPLDIVLVLDDSGSMDYSMSMEAGYYEVSAGSVVTSTGHISDDFWNDGQAVQDTRGGTYYALVDGEYVRITEVTNEVSGSWRTSYDEHVRWELNGQTVTPDDTTFYEYIDGSISRTEALQRAVNSFIDQTATMNASITDQADKIRISIVVFANNANTRNGLTVCEGDNVSALKSTVNGLTGNGATNAGAGMSNANTVLRNSDRPDANQVVVFFTDGVPTTSNSFSSSVANTAVTNSWAIKNRGGTVYSVGIFDGADPSQTELPWWNPDDTDRANVFMNAVSSNYPNASEWNNLGDRAPDNPDGTPTDYYKATSDAGELSKIFDDIFDDSTSNIGSGSPIEEVTTGGANNTPGNLVFTDQLGSYMEVTGTGAGTDKMQLAYGDQLITSDSRDEARTDNATVYTYHFSGTVEGNEVYHEANLADFSVVVTNYDDPATGDLVTVTIPASLIPMRNYDVNTDNNTMTVSEAYPVRLFYGVSVKSDVADVLADPSSNSELYSQIVESNASSNGSTLDFYSNAYNGGTDGATTSTFTPSEGNRFYYYTENEQLYLDADCTQPATRTNIEDNTGTLYYQDTYWQQGEDGTSATQETEHIAVDVSGSDLTFVEYDPSTGNAYIPSGTQRLDRPNTLTAAKDRNVTGTATNVLHPSWVGSNVTQYLGNNGKLSVDLPGDLVIAKTVNWGNASDSTKENQKTFTFRVNFNGDESLEGTFNYEVLGVDDMQIRTGTISDGSTIDLEDGQRVVITGLPAGTTYTVTEQNANANGFTTTDNSTGDGANTTDGVVAGTIVGGAQQTASFTNNYDASTPIILDTSTVLNVRKVLDGREWRDSDSFTFNLRPVDGAPESDDGDVEITDATPNHTIAFGDIEFTEVGEYRYTITEDNDTNPIIGIDYSGAEYRMVVTVIDGGNGKLAIDEVVIQQVSDDDGNMGDISVVAGDTVTFTNRYLSDQGATNINGKKEYIDNAGGNTNGPGKFQFQLEALGGYDTNNKPGDGSYTYPANETPMPEDAVNNISTAGNLGGEFSFPTIYFDGDDVGRTYEYKVTEIPGDEQGMTYDDTMYTLTIEVTEELEGEGEDAHAHIVAKVSHTPDQLKFTNTYDPNDAHLTGDAAIHGTKVLTGRDMLENETFYFQLTQMDGPTTVLATPEIATVSAADGDMNFNFSDMTFSRTGDYTFTINEVADADGNETKDGNGLTYSQNICTVTVHVVDHRTGVLTARAEYSNQIGTDSSQAVFTNTYTASMNYGTEGGIVVTKQMLDRNMAAGDFDFTITGEDDAAGMVGSADANFENPTMGANAIANMRKLQNLTFNQSHAGNTYSFIVDEVDPVEGEGLAGVTYDQSQYRVDITPIDNGDGTMHALTTVTRIMNTNGEPDNTVIVNQPNSNDEAVPIFGFVNDYNPNPAVIGDDADTALQVTKTVTGAPSPDGVEYSFTLTAQDTEQGRLANIGGLDGNNQLTVNTTGVINADVNDSADDSQTVSFGQLTFSAPGTYTFTVQENAPDADAGWNYDTTPKTVRVVVTDRNADGQYDGNLYIQHVYGNPVTVTNSYEPGSVTVGEGAVAPITVQKTVTGSATQTDFSFELSAVDPTDDKWDNVEPVDPGYDRTATITEDFVDGAIKTATFGGIKFNAAGEYQFKIVETGTDNVPAGWTYDTHEATVTVTVTDTDYDGHLEATVVYNNTTATTDDDKDVTNAAAFTNVYNASGELDGAANLTVTKNFRSNLGDPWTEDDSFSFKLEADVSHADTKTAVDNGWIALPDNAGKIDITDESTEHQASFGDIKFTHAGTYQFLVSEILPEGVDESNNWTKDGITYDHSTKTVTVNVVDNGDGTLAASVAEGSDNLTFTNTYSVGQITYRAAYFQLQGNKVLEGRNWEQGDTFEFTLTPGVGTNLDGEEISADVVRATMPTKTTDTIEPLAGDGSWVSDNSAQFSFTDDRTPGEGTVPEDQFTFTQPGTYRYLINETNPNATEAGSGILGVTYDQTTYRLTVTVADMGDGTLRVSNYQYSKRELGETNFTPIDSSREVTFTNVYSANTVGISYNAAKVLSGRNTPMGDGEFTFHMEFAGWKVNDSADDWSMEDDVAANAPAAAGDADNIVRGDVTFQNINFTSDHVGYTYRYAITENQPTEDGTYDGIPLEGATKNEAGQWVYKGVAYDNTTKYVTAKVTSERGTAEDGSPIEIVRVNTDGEATWDEASGSFEGGAIFTNTYVASSTILSGAKNLEVEKELIGRDWIGISDDKKLGDKYTFTLEVGDEITKQAVDDGEVILPEKTTIEITADTSEHKAAFEDITFTKAGTYTFTVTESGDVPGVINDPKAVRTITVKVTDNNDGTLTAEVVGGESEDLKFTNTYDPGTITLTGDSALKVQKTLRGREWADSEAYSFTIKSTSAPEGVAAEDIPMPGETEINIGKPADGNVNTATFGDMTFSQAGEYVYEITEVIPEAAEENMTYDGYHVTVTIIVAEDQAAGELTAHVTYNNGDQKVDDDNNNNERNNNDDEFVTDAAAFTNVKSVETTYNLEGTKVIEGRDFQEGDAFTFELRAVDKAPLPKDGENIITSVTIDQDDVREDEVNTADISFGKITFTEPGQYVYKISEIEPEEADRIEGMTYDTAERSVIIEVTADEQGDMTAEMIEPADGLVWTNTWADDTEPVLSGLTGTKNLTGTAMAEGQFTFLIQPQGNAPMGDSMMAAFNGEVTQNEDGSYTAPISLLNNVTYTENGDYVYIISEVNDGQRGITYDTTKYRVTVHVDGGNVTTGIESTTDEAITGDTEWTEAEAIVFNNSYTTSLNYNTAGGLSIIKNLKGHDIAADQFGFTVKAADDASREKAGFKEMSQNYATSASRMNGNGVSTDSMSVFGDIAFTQADAGKTYTYTISETTGGNTDAGYTNDTRTYTVEITTADDGKGSLTVTTQVTSDQGDEATYTYSNKAGTDQPAVVTFDNTYEASGGIGGEGQVSIIAKKELANSTLNGDDFTFTITDEAGKEVASGTNDASGTITFSEIDYTKDSLIADVASGAAVYSQVDGKDTYTYQYTVAETGDMPDGVSQVAASFQIQVTVTDNNDGTLSAAVTYPEGSEDGLVFRNTYGSEAEAQINVAGKKILNVESGDNVPDITHKYRFTITGVDEDGNQAPLPGNTTVANDATGSVTFGDIVYTMENVFGNDPVTESVDEVSGETTEATADVHTDEAQTDDVQTDEAQTDEASGAVSEEADNTADNVRGAERTKTFYYTVTEAGSVAGVTNDPDAKPFTVTVKDNGDGTLSVESSATAGAQFEFVNTYSVDPTDPESPTDPDAEGGVTITKVLEGRDLKEGEFQFTMTGIAGTISEGMSVSGQNDAEGNVVLGGLVFEAPGTYEFNISEVIPDTLLGGVTYDGHIYTALANVKDNGDGTLSVAWTVSNGTETVDQITFTNTYKADAVGNVILQATKKLEGRDLKDGEFTFQLKDENGEVISEAANTVNGSVRFDALSFDKAGTYNYTVSEVKGNDDTITYDDTVYNVTVTVTDDLQGHLVATVTGEGGNELNMTFNNKYTKPAEPQNPDDDGTPKAVQTGDTTPIIPAVIAVLVSLAAIAAVVVIIMRRRRR